MSAVKDFAAELPATALVCLRDRATLRVACDECGIKSLADLMPISSRRDVLEAMSRLKGVGPKRIYRWRKKLFLDEQTESVGILSFDHWVELSIKNALRNYKSWFEK